MTKLFLTLAAAIAIGGIASSAEAHVKRNQDRVKFICDAHGCTVKATAHGHHHHGRRVKRTKIRFNGDVCRFKPWKNVTVCRY